MFRFIEDIAIADIAFEVEALDLPELFTDAAEAFLSVLIDNPTVLQAEKTLQIELNHRDLDILLYLFLQELVYHKDVSALLLKVTRAQIAKAAKGFHLMADMAGEPIDPKRHIQRADVKAVTLHQLEVKETSRGLYAKVILDI